MAKAELLFAELFKSLLSLYNKLNATQSVIIFLSSCPKIVTVHGVELKGKSISTHNAKRV